MDIPDFLDHPCDVGPPAEYADAPTCNLRYAVQTALGGIVTVERPVPLTTNLDDFVKAARHVLLHQDKISPTLVDRYVRATNLCTEQGVVLDCLRDFFHLLPDCSISVSDSTGTCCTLGRYHLAWNVRLENGVVGAVWAQLATTLDDCKANLFSQLRALGVFHHDTQAPLTLISNDGLDTPISSPMQMRCATIRVPGRFAVGAPAAVTVDHPDLSSYEFSGVFRKFRSNRTGKWVVDRSDWPR